MCSCVFYKFTNNFTLILNLRSNLILIYLPVENTPITSTNVALIKVSNEGGDATTMTYSLSDPADLNGMGEEGEPYLAVSL